MEREAGSRMGSCILNVRRLLEVHRGRYSVQNTSNAQGPITVPSIRILSAKKERKPPKQIADIVDFNHGGRLTYMHFWNCNHIHKRSVANALS